MKVAIFIGYIIVAIFTYIFVNFMLISDLDDREFDEVMNDSSAKLLALLTISLCWPVTVPIILFNNIFDKEER